MSRVINFSAGPAALPLPVLEKIQAELFDWQGLGVSIMELGHRTAPFQEMAYQTETSLRQLLNVPGNYKILFLSGGARVQFAMVPLNLLGKKTRADYLNTGHWSGVAIKEAQKYCQVDTVATLASAEPLAIPETNTWQCHADAAYRHFTDNETISGVEFYQTPVLDDVPLVCDMTSSLLTKEIDVTQYGCIYAGTQKNMGIAGMTIVIIREDLLGQAHASTPSVYDYQIEAETDSFYVTPPTFPWYVSGLVFEWMLQAGGLHVFAQRNAQKAKRLYDCIDSNPFYRNPIAPTCRSRVNVPFRLAKAECEGIFLEEARANGLAFLKGHKSIGGCRASIYNAISLSDVDKLCDFMQDFSAKHGEGA